MSSPGFGRHSSRITSGLGGVVLLVAAVALVWCLPYAAAVAITATALPTFEGTGGFGDDFQGIPWSLIHAQLLRELLGEEGGNGNMRRDASTGDPCGWAQSYIGPNVSKEECPLCLSDGCLRWIDDPACVDCRPRVENYNFTYPLGFTILIVFGLSFIIRQTRMGYQKQPGGGFTPFLFAACVIVFSSTFLAISSSSMWGFDGRFSLKTYLRTYMFGYGTSMAPECITCLALLILVYYNTKSKNRSLAVAKPGVIIPLMVLISAVIAYTLFAFLGVSIHLSNVLIKNGSSEFSQKATILAYVGRGLILVCLMVSIPPVFVRLTKSIRRVRNNDMVKHMRYRVCFFALVSFFCSGIHLARMLLYQYKIKIHFLFFTFDLLEFSRIAELVGMANVLYLADSTFNDYPLQEIISLLSGDWHRRVTCFNVDTTVTARTTTNSTTSNDDGGGEASTAVDGTGKTSKSRSPKSKTDYSRRHSVVSSSAAASATAAGDLEMGNIPPSVRN